MGYAAEGRHLMDVLLDTCAVVWAVLDPDRISKAATRVLLAPDSVVHVSAISAAEIACAVERGRITLAQHWRRWFRVHLDANGWACLPIDLETVEEAFSLPPPFHDDPADRMIVATARLRRLHVVTADGKILGYPHVRTVW
jgi:PIN domain nuclease of toxin-antitoxin system